MTGPRGKNMAERMETVLTILRESDKPMRCLEICAKAYGTSSEYGNVMAALRHLINEDLVEKLSSKDLQYYVKIGGREVQMGPDANAVAFRAIDAKKVSRKAAAERRERKRQQEIVARIESTGDLYGRVTA